MYCFEKKETYDNGKAYGIWWEKKIYALLSIALFCYFSNFAIITYGLYP